jgi:hypothetical protein
MMIRLLLLLNLLFISSASYADISRPESQAATTIYSTIFVTDVDNVDSANQSFVAGMDCLPGLKV